MDPEARERLTRRTFALRDLVFVVWKNQIDAAGVDIDRRLAEPPHGHRRALAMPSGPSRWLDNIPCRLTRLRGLPQDEIPNVFLLVVVAVDTRAGFHAFGVE